MKGRPRAKRRLVLDHRYMSLALVTVTGEGGREATYIHGTGPHIAYAVPLWDDGTVTLNRQRRYGMRGWSVEVPGGHVDPGEAPRAAALRELREEKGVVAPRTAPLWSGIATIKVQQPMHVYLATGLRQARAARDDDEVIETIRIPLRTAVTRALRGWVRHAPSVLALLAAERAAAQAPSPRRASRSST